MNVYINASFNRENKVTQVWSDTFYYKNAESNNGQETYDSLLQVKSFLIADSIIDKLAVRQFITTKEQLRKRLNAITQGVYSGVSR